MRVAVDDRHPPVDPGGVELFQASLWSRLRLSDAWALHCDASHGVSVFFEKTHRHHRAEVWDESAWTRAIRLEP